MYASGYACLCTLASYLKSILLLVTLLIRRSHPDHWVALFERLGMSTLIQRGMKIGAQIVNKVRVALVIRTKA